MLQVMLGLCTVIFVHELGHFAVAKACGVKCEKFYLFFDVRGWKLFSFKWGETEYGMGWLPLGGYVKMLGQDDDPGKAQAEMERARLQREGGELAPGESPFDPRSYLAKPVWQRMAIISAGVIMNVIFAVVFSTIAYRNGVHEPPCVVGSLVPGDAAWRAGLRPGDRITRIGDIHHPRFRDLTKRVTVGDNLEAGIEFVVERPGESSPLDFRIVPSQKGSYPRIGIVSASTPKLVAFDKKEKWPLESCLAPADRRPKFAGGDEIIAIDGRQVADFLEIRQELLRNPGATRFTVRRAIAEKDAKARAGSEPRFEEIEIELPPRPMKTFGFVMEMGPITAIRANSPAEKAGIRVGDRLIEFDGKAEFDPFRLPEIARHRDTVLLRVAREDVTLDFELAADASVIQDDETRGLGGVISLSGLGLTYSVGNRVASLASGAEGENSEIPLGVEVTEIKLLPPDEKTQEVYDFKQKEIDFEPRKGLEHEIWPQVFATMQDALPGSKLRLTFANEKVVETSIDDDPTWLNADRGFLFEGMADFVVASDWGEALAWGGAETLDSLTTVFRFLRKLVERQVSWKNMAGPVSIAKFAYSTASRGWPEFLMFLTMLSANLAVMNFMPIPVLDGGHMVFLTLEAIRRRPVSEKIVTPFLYIGFALLLTLMLVVFLLDLGFISRL